MANVETATNLQTQPEAVTLPEVGALPEAGAKTPRINDGKLPCFEFVTAEKAGLYRAIMRLFVEAKAQFKLHLRPEQVAAGRDALAGQALPYVLQRGERALRQVSRALQRGERALRKVCGALRCG